VSTSPPSQPTFSPGAWLSRRYAARAALEQKLLQERVRYARQRERQEELAPRRQGSARRRGFFAGFDPIGFLLGVLLGSRFGKH
jgi:hypothetical protein